MTREEAKELLPIIKAYVEGKTIQCLIDDKWTDVNDDVKLYFTDPYYNYRIKPESKYRPFKDKDECWNEMMKHEPFGWLKRDTYYQNIMAVDCTYIYIETLSTNFNYKEALDEFTFADGTPFGVKEE